MPTPDASWAPWAVAAFDQRAAGLDLARLAIALGLTAALLLIFLGAIVSTLVLRGN